MTTNAVRCAVLCVSFVTSWAVAGCGKSCAELENLDCSTIKDEKEKSSCLTFKKSAVETGNEETCKVTLNAQAGKGATKK